MTTVTEAHAARPNGHAQTSAALALRDGQDFWDAKQIAALNQLGITGASNADLAIYLHYCQKTGLDPFARQIYMIARRTKDADGKWVVRQTIQIGIDGYRVVANRAARRDGVILSYGPTTWYDADGQPYPVWVHNTPPAAAAVTVYRDGSAFPGVARFASFAATNRDGELTGQWATMGDHMIAKCAEAQALRKAFPHDLAGTVSDDEAAHQENTPPARPRRPSRAVTVASTQTVHEAEIVEDPQPESPLPPQDGKPAPLPSVRKLEKLLGSLPLGPEEDVKALLDWLCGAPYTATRAQVQLVTSWLDDHLQTAHGDTEAAAEAIWGQHNAAVAQHASEAAAGTGDGDSDD